MKIIVAGGSGLIGRSLVPALAGAGHEPVVLSRRNGAAGSGARVVQWDGRTLEGGWGTELAEAGAIVNLAGVSIGSGRWTRRRKRAILASRVESTSALVAAVGRLPQARRPSVLVNASGVDYVGDAGDVFVSEEAPAGESFLASVCVAWEAAARRAEALGLRVVLMRTPLVLACDALALKLMALPFRLLLGGRLGSGKQWFPWVHMADIVGLYGLAVERVDLRGPVNAVAPDVRRQADVAAELGRVLGRPAAVPTPASLLRVVLGEQADLLLHGQRAVSRKLSAYAFRHPQLRDALEDALR